MHYWQHSVYTSCGFQSNLQVQSSLASAVTWDSEVTTSSRTLHTLNVSSLSILKTFTVTDGLSNFQIGFAPQPRERAK